MTRPAPAAPAPSPYAARPWLALLSPDQRAPFTPLPSPVHALRAAAARAPRHPALVHEAGSLAYAELDARTDTLARHLLALGLGDGARIAVRLQNGPALVLAALAVWKAGAVLVPVNPMYRAAELRHVLTDSGALALIRAHTPTAADDPAAGLADGLADTPVRVLLTTDEDTPRPARPASAPPGTAAHDLWTLAEDPRPEALPPLPAPPGPEDTALLGYTSGTTGAPKGAINPHGALTHNAGRQVAGHPIPEGAGYLVLAPLFHITGLVCELVACLINAGTLILTGRFDAGRLLRACRAHRPAYTIGPTTAWLALIAHPEADRDAFASFRVTSCGGAPVPAALTARLRAEFGLVLRPGYGLTETTGGCASVPVHHPAEGVVDPASGTLSVGVPGAETLIRILDDAGREVPLGAPGEIAVRGPQLARGYWNRPEADAEAFPDGELRTGDIGFMDEAGRLYVIDRKKDMINASGFKVWPREVEDVLHAHPGVHEAAVVGVPDPYRGETVVAWIVPRGSVEDPAGLVAELLAHCADRLAAYKRPRRIESVPVLPRTGSGKILRRELRERG
ncbi:class I adenylate-forming enzyme family protein [Streptomyces sp. BI20]|uniref:class I adenylate-forming enzyme family protein n=1 Tax=Streptomyces sp. BI20 TaxID=3403460 RepID=UPI003C77CB34